MQDLAFFQFGVERVASLINATLSLAVNVDLRQYIFMAITATWVFVCLVDQRLDRAFAVSDDMGRNTLEKVRDCLLHGEPEIVWQPEFDRAKEVLERSLLR